MRQARSLAWILAAITLLGLALYIGYALTVDDANPGLLALGVFASVGLFAAAVTAALGLGAGRLWGARVLSGVLAAQLVVYVVLLLSGSGAGGIIPIVLNAIAVGKLRRPEARAYLRRA